MRINRYSPLCAAIVATTSLLFAGGVEGAAQVVQGVCSDAPTGVLPSCTCKSPSGYTIQLQQEIPSPTQITYRYTVSGGGNAKVSAIRETQLIVPRPVSTTNQDPTAGKGVVIAGDVTAINNYCVPDANSGNNKGNCDGFLVHAAVHSATNTSGLIDIPVGTNVADGMVTFNIIGGNGNTELCSAVDNNGVVLPIPSGIAGPGDIGDPFQPKFTQTQATVAGGQCNAILTFDKKGRVIDVATTTPGCCVGSPGQQDSCGGNSSPDALKVNINGQLQDISNNNAEFGITIGTHTSTCYGPSIPSPAKCICTASPCP